MGIRPVNGKIEKNWIDMNFLSGERMIAARRLVRQEGDHWRRVILGKGRENA